MNGVLKGQINSCIWIGYRVEIIEYSLIHLLIMEKEAKLSLQLDEKALRNICHKSYPSYNIEGHTATVYGPKKLIVQVPSSPNYEACSTYKTCRHLRRK
jgi:hypothetical protein